MKSAVILSGCGYLDGAEIRESVLSMLYLDQASVEYGCFAPDILQSDTINHLQKAPAAEQRNVLTEAARIARSDVQPLAALQAGDFDMLVIPGGFGVAKNLSDLASKGAECTVLPEFAAAIKAFYDAGKPIVAICIAPAVLAAALKGAGITLTVGDAPDVEAAITAFGNHPQKSPTEQAVVDTQHRVVSCSAYMRDDTIANVAKGIEQAITAGIHLVKKSTSQAA